MTRPSEEELRKRFLDDLRALEGIEKEDAARLLGELRQDGSGDIGELRTRFLFVALRYERERRELAAEPAENPHRDKQAAYNRLDLDFCYRYLINIIASLGRHPATQVLARLENAIIDVLAGTKPALFFEIESAEPKKGNARGRSTAGAAQAEAAEIFDLLTKCKSHANAIAWIDAECRRLRLVDAGGNLLTGKRFAVWRNQCSRGLGAGHKSYEPVERLLKSYSVEIIDAVLGTGAAAVLRAPASELRERRIEEIAQSRLNSMARGYNRQFPVISVRSRSPQPTPAGR